MDIDWVIDCMRKLIWSSLVASFSKQLILSLIISIFSPILQARNIWHRWFKALLNLFGVYIDSTRIKKPPNNMNILGIDREIKTMRLVIFSLAYNNDDRKQHTLKNGLTRPLPLKIRIIINCQVGNQTQFNKKLHPIKKLVWVITNHGTTLYNTSIITPLMKLLTQVLTRTNLKEILEQRCG